MSASSQSYPRTEARFTPLTITEAPVDRAPSKLLLGKSSVYSYAVAGTLVGVLAGVAIGTSTWIPGWLNSKTTPATPHPAAIAAPPGGPKDLGSVNAIAAGLKGRLVTEWHEKPSYRLLIEPSDPARQEEFALAVTSSPRPLSVAFQLVDSTGTALCGQDVVLRFDAERAAMGAAAGGASQAQPTSAEIDQLKAQESARERGRDIFDNEIGDNGQITGLDARGEMPCSAQAYQSAASWTLAPDFPSVAEQAELLKQQTESTAAQKAAPAHKPETGKKTEVHKLTASLDGFLLPKPAGR